MKCPKCGYNSFEYHTSCKKCSSDFISYKQTYNITSIVLPPEAREERANEFRTASSANEQPVENVETHDDMFAFALPEDVAPPPSSVTRNDDPFNFDDLPEVAPQQAKVEEGGFSDLLESASRNGDDPFASYATDSPAPPAKTEAPTPDTGEFGLENFSWDDTSAATSMSGGQASADDFDSLFGDTKDSAKK